jgi:hypothetical protein|tara:strand:- start:49 stop:1371 length:1323 start_codon:yes stop_codon:yes gene_type:complete
VATKKISQLETISDANLSGEAILPVVVSDPLIPNRKAKVNQLFRGVSQGTKAAPGIAFDLDRDTGFYQTAYDQLGIAFGDGGFYCSRIDNGNSSTSLYITAQDDVATNTDIVLAPKGTGAVKVTGQFLMEDGSFILEDAQGPKARFEVSNVGTGTNTRIMTLPAITSGNGTTLVGADTQQTLTNKTILINENNFVIVDGTEEAIFQINWATTSGARRSYFLPDAGSVTTTSEPTATSSTLLDTKAEQTALSKTFVNLKLAANAESATASVQWNTDAVTSNRIITMPDQSGTVVMEDTTQIMSNKSIKALQLADTTDVTKKITFDVSNQNTLSNESFQVPPTNNLNRSGNHNVIVTERGDQGLYYKSMYNMSLKDSTNVAASVVLSAEGITGPRTIKFPDADATLLSTENVTLEDVTFGAGIGANNLTGLTRQQQFFYAGF